MKKITLTQAIEGFVLAKSAEHLSPHTLSDYNNAFRHLQEYLNADPPLTSITVEQR